MSTRCSWRRGAPSRNGGKGGQRRSPVYFEGSDGKENRLVDSDPKKLFAPLPVLQVTGKQARDKVNKNQYEAPAYKVKKRTGLNFISTFPLRTEDPPSKWIMRGVALLCSVD